jgi:plasmid stabilization system protein ParE
MPDKTYELRYLPLFYDDLEKNVLYIAEELNNPQAARRLMDAVKTAILERLPYAESFEKYYSEKERELPYYRIYVDNYIIWYVVIDDSDAGSIMEIRRFSFKSQDQTKLL